MNPLTIWWLELGVQCLFPPPPDYPSVQWGFRREGSMTTMEEEKQQRLNLCGCPWCGLFLGPFSPLFLSAAVNMYQFSSVEKAHLYVQQPCRMGTVPPTSRDSVNIGGLRMCQSNFILILVMPWQNNSCMLQLDCPSLAVIQWPTHEWNEGAGCYSEDRPSSRLSSHHRNCLRHMNGLQSANTSICSFGPYHVYCSGLWGKQRKVPAHGIDILLETVRAKWRKTCCSWLTFLVVMDFSSLLLRLKIFSSWSRENGLSFWVST